MNPRIHWHEQVEIMIIVRLTSEPHHNRQNFIDNPYYDTGYANWRLSMRPHLWRPLTDVYEMEDHFVVRVEIPGMNESDFQINIDRNVLSISGNRPDTGERRAFHQMEIHFGEFISQVELPSNIDQEKIEAEYQNGFLRLILPKAQPKQIKISKE